MDELELANKFNRRRPQLRAVAYRILGSVSEADDAVQEAWLRLQRTDAEQIDSLERWLTTVVARICLNMLRSRRTRGEQPLDGLRPEPIVDDPTVGTDPEHEALLADSVGIALQVVLDTLSPAERLAFVLHDMFAVPFDEIAAMVDRSPQATRQLASRARRRVREAAPPPDPDLTHQRAVVDACCVVGTRLLNARDADSSFDGQGRSRVTSERTLALRAKRKLAVLPRRVVAPELTLEPLAQLVGAGSRCARAAAGTRRPAAGAAARRSARAAWRRSTRAAAGPARRGAA